MEVDDTARLEAALRGQAWLIGVTHEGRELDLEVTDLDDAYRHVPAAVAAEGLALRRLEAAEVSLEEVFVDLVEGAAPGAAPDAGPGAAPGAGPGAAP